MSQTMYLNQFNQTPIKGNSATKVNLNTLSVVVDPSSVNTILPGDQVILTGSTGNVIYVDKCTAAQLGIGYVFYSMKTEKFTANMALTIGLGTSILFGEAGGTITRGQYLEYVPNAVVTGPTMIASAGVNPVTAIALDNAVSGGIFRFMVLNVADLPDQSVQALTVVSGNNSINPSLGDVIDISATVSATLNVASVVAGKRLVFIINNAGTSGTLVMTLGTNIRAVSATIPTSATQNKIVTIAFVSDGTNYDEVSRTPLYSQL